jgi:broad specificity phosphatase PhoE
VSTAPAQRVTLVRHGETEWTLSGQHTGRTDIPLTDRGRRQAELVGERLADERQGEAFDLVMTSPLSRATETCRLAGLAQRAIVTADLAEWDYGEYEGRRTDEIRTERAGWLLWRDGVPDGETADEVAQRVDRVIDRVRATDGDVALVSHGHVLRVLAARWLGLHPTYGAYLALGTAAICRLGWEREVPVIAGWNDLSHISTMDDTMDEQPRRPSRQDAGQDTRQDVDQDIRR